MLQKIKNFDMARLAARDDVEAALSAANEDLAYCLSQALRAVL